MFRLLKTFALAMALASLATFACAKEPAQAWPAISFAGVKEGAAVLTTRDDFVERMSPFDRAARMKTDREVTEEVYLRFVASNVLVWSVDDKAKIETALKSVRPAIEALQLPWPGSMLLIKTTGNEEGDAEYTRANAIILPVSALKPEAQNTLGKILAHEMFHVLSRANPALKEKLYAAIGFLSCGEVPLPPTLRPLRITNPDAPKNDHCIRLQVAGASVWGVPILFSKSQQYDVSKGGAFFDYLDFKFLVVDAASGGDATPPPMSVWDESKARLVAPNEVGGLFEQIGKNTGYILHPEEVLADNFALLVLGSKDLPSPQVQDRIRQILRAH